MNHPISIVKNMDCVEGMKDFPDKFFDLAIVMLKYLFIFIYNFNYKYFQNDT